MEQLIYLKDVVTLELEEEKCSGCGMCLIVCPHAVLGMNEKHVKIEHRDACMECGACAKNCPTDALSVQAGVGCAAAVINAALGREGDCCCVIESPSQ
jgi:NAD-dependent dihydropyrimidine dehydrogenase PreA subunit